MKTIIRNIGKVLKRERGFTLVEMVTVVAIMGVMAAVAVPMVSSQLSKTREKSYQQDQSLIQTAVDSFYTAADNVRYLGQRQYPIMGADSTGTTKPWVDEGLDGELPDPLLNPLKGIQGGEPKWRDDGDGNREATEENLNGEADTIAGDDTGWYVAKVSFQGADYAADSRSYFMDFNKLVEAGLLQTVPQSASLDNGGGSEEGSYSWYVKSTGVVESLFYHLPSNGTGFNGESDNTLDLRGFVEGVYP